MKTFIPALIAIVLVCHGPLPRAQQITYDDLEVESIVRVYDGDTFIANLKDVHPLLGKEIKIRIRGIDTPEIRGSCKSVKMFAYRVKKYVKNKLDNADEIKLWTIGRGKYFRLIADVYVDGQNLGHHLLELGMAKPYDGGTKLEWECVDYEK